MSNSKILNSPRLLELKRKRKRNFLHRILFMCAAVIVVLVGLSFVLKIPQLNISEVVVEGNEAILPENIKAIVDQEISGKYLYFFPKANFILYPKREIKKDLTDKIKRIKDVSVGLADSNVLKVVVTERQGEYAWCGQKSSTKDKCYFIDDKGYVFDELPYFSGQVYFQFYGGDVDTDTPMGSYFSEKYLDEFIKFKSILEAIKLKPVGLELEGEDAKVILSNVGNNPEVLVKAEDDLEKAAENLQSALATEPLKSEFRDKYASLKYIDLRFGNKVYYKFAN